MLDPKNKRLKSHFLTKNNSCIISVIISPDLTAKNGPELQYLENHKNSIFYS